MNEIPVAVQLLYDTWVTPPQPDRWPEELRSAPVEGHGMYAFYRGLTLGLQLAIDCLDWS